MLEANEHFQKQTCRNRCYINTEHGKDHLSVPLTGKHGKVMIKDVRIDHGQKWMNNHWRTIRSAYGKAPFFEYYADDFEKALLKKFDFLYDLNFALLTLCLRFLKFDIAVKETLSYEQHYMADVLDARNVINLKNQGNAQIFYKPLPYYQVFGNAFVENLSIVDLIFCCGPEAGSIVKASSASSEQIQF
jgi:hypothetical protein